ncbi:MAG: DUF1080 domain-containing protein, partial [Bacteroidales bacterium]|nr:DUF1080 domain-containing protein [Bacteroidales bacterium]
SKFIYALSKFIYALSKFIYALSKFCSARVQMPFPATRHIPAFAVIEIKKPPTVHSTNNVGCKPVWLPSCFSRCFQISLISISYQNVFFVFLGIPLRKTGKEELAEKLDAEGHIAFQVHGGKGSWKEGAKCRWRNIRIRELPS